jgi:hypothetical protein
LADRPRALHPDVVLYGGAVLSPEGRDLIAEVLRPRQIVGFYPTTDAGPIGYSLNDDGHYSTFSETHIVEVVDATGQPVEPGQRGDLVVTVLGNRAAPLIRYRVGDEVTLVSRGNRTVVSDIQRTGDLSLGDGLLAVAEVQGWLRALGERGIPAVGLQLVVRACQSGLDQPVLRLFGSVPLLPAEQAARELFNANTQMLHGITSGVMHELEVVVDAELPTALHEGWKLPPVLDERPRQPA